MYAVSDMEPLPSPKTTPEQPKLPRFGLKFFLSRLGILVALLAVAYFAFAGSALLSVNRLPDAHVPNACGDTPFNVMVRTKLQPFGHAVSRTLFGMILFSALYAFLFRQDERRKALAVRYLVFGLIVLPPAWVAWVLFASISSCHPI